MEVISREGTPERAEVRCRVLHAGRQKEFLGFCRAGNAVLEAIILATRVDLLDPAIVGERMAQYQEIVEKTGDENERRAFHMVHDYIQKGG